MILSGGWDGQDMKIEFNELDFYVLSHVSSLVNRVLWTRIVINEISLKLCLTYNIVWVGWLFFLKTPLFVIDKSHK